MRRLSHPNVMTAFRLFTCSVPRAATGLLMPVGDGNATVLCIDYSGSRRSWRVLRQLLLALNHLCQRDSWRSSSHCPLVETY